MELAQQGSEASAQRALLGAGSGDPSRAPGWGRDGAALHARGTGVPPERWCVTREDLEQLRADLKREVAAGRIVPTERDPFDANDHKIGPTMYTVTDQYIKPLTRDAGLMSYALLKHPEGILCDLFVTHAWAEGSYEFLDKVITAWPRGKAAAWICILANPQNLDISELIQEPRSSPFALALESASHMLVVPNQKLSIYTRIWCAYEAWLAMTGTKIILTARPSQRGACVRRMSVLPVVFSAAFSITVLVDLTEDQLSSIYDNLNVLVGWTVLVLCCLRSRWLVFGLSIAGCAVLAVWTAANYLIDPEVNESDFLAGIFFLFFVSRVRDGVVRAAISDERTLLLTDTSGVQNALSSDELDKEHILRDIGDALETVNDSIAVLQECGMSTEALRESHALGLSVAGAADLSWTLTGFFIGWSVFPLVLLMQQVSRPSWSWDVWSIIAISLAQGLCAAFALKAFWAAEEDGQAFAGSAFVRFFALCMVSSSFFLPSSADAGAVYVAMIFLPVYVAHLLCARGRKAMLSVPGIGLALTRFSMEGCTPRLCVIAAALLAAMVAFYFALAELLQLLGPSL